MFNGWGGSLPPLFWEHPALGGFFVTGGKGFSGVSRKIFSRTEKDKIRNTEKLVPPACC